VAYLVYLSTRAPAGWTENLQRAGHTVWEALAVSEVLHLSAEHPVDAVIVAAEVTARQRQAVSAHCVCLMLSAEASGADILWELEQLFPQAQHHGVQ
jgi:hypothetical protein